MLVGCNFMHFVNGLIVNTRFSSTNTKPSVTTPNIVTRVITYVRLFSKFFTVCYIGGSTFSASYLQIHLGSLRMCPFSVPTFQMQELYT